MNKPGKQALLWPAECQALHFRPRLGGIRRKNCWWTTLKKRPPGPQPCISIPMQQLLNITDPLAPKAETRSRGDGFQLRVPVSPRLPFMFYYLYVSLKIGRS